MPDPVKGSCAANRAAIGCLAALTCCFLVFVCCGGLMMLVPRLTSPTVAESPTQPTPPIVEKTTALALCQSFLSDRVRSNNRYSGKTLQVSGTVHTAEWSPIRSEGLYVILDPGDKHSVLTAWFTAAHEKAVKALGKGQIVEVQGKVGQVTYPQQGHVWITLDDCQVIGTK